MSSFETNLEVLRLAIKFTEDHYEIQDDIEYEDTVVDIAKTFHTFVWGLPEDESPPLHAGNSPVASNVTILNPHTPNKPTDI